MKILDSSPIIAILGDLSNPELLSFFITIGCPLYVPTRVVDEVLGNPERENLAKLIKEGVVTKLDPCDELVLQGFRNRHLQLGAGESEVILHAQQWISLGKHFCCVVDDKVARRTAEGLGISCVGTIGLLDELRDRGMISKDDLNKFHNKLKESGFRYKFISIQDPK